MKKKVKFFLLKNAPFLHNLILRIRQYFRNIIYIIFSEYIHVSLDRKVKGSSITPREPGFVFSFIKDNYLTSILGLKK